VVPTRDGARCLLLDADHRVIAASDDAGVLQRTLPLRTQGKDAGYYLDDAGEQVGFALTPGYETYAGLGWYGVIVQHPLRELAAGSIERR
jgi:hypothetical protein